MSNSSPTLNFSTPRRARQAVQHLRAEHRALVVHERQDDRPLAEELAEPHVTSRFVLERQIERQLRVELLIEPDLGQQLRQLVRWRLRRRLALVQRWRALGRRENQRRGTSRLRPRSEPSVSLRCLLAVANSTVAGSRAHETGPGAWSLSLNSLMASADARSSAAARSNFPSASAIRSMALMHRSPSARHRRLERQRSRARRWSRRRLAAACDTAGHVRPAGPSPARPGCAPCRRSGRSTRRCRPAACRAAAVSLMSWNGYVCSRGGGGSGRSAPVRLIGYRAVFSAASRRSR